MATLEKNLIKRLKLIIDDANVIIEHLEKGKGIENDSIHGLTIYSHIKNISIAIDLNNDESLEWGFYNNL
jgi:hypothetical protein